MIYILMYSGTEKSNDIFVALFNISDHLYGNESTIWKVIYTPSTNLLFDNVKADLKIDESKKADISVDLSTKAPDSGVFRNISLKNYEELKLG